MKRTAQPRRAIGLAGVVWTAGALSLALPPPRAAAQPAPAENTRGLHYWAKYTPQLYDRFNSGTLPEQQLKDEVHATLTSPEPGVRQAALKAVHGLGAKADFAAADVIRLLDDPTIPPVDYAFSGMTHRIGHLAAQSLAAMGPAGQPALSAALRGDRKEARRNALHVARQIEDPAIVDALITALRGGNEDERHEAYLALVQGKAALPAKSVIASCGDPDEAVRSACVRTLGRLRDRAATDAVLKALSDPSHSVRDAAEQVLAGSGEWLRDDRAALPLTVILTSHENDGVRAGAAAALGNYGGVRVVRALVAALDDKYSNTRSAAVTSLGKIEDWSAVPRLIDVMADPAHSAGWIDKEARRVLREMGVGPAVLEAVTYEGRPNFPAVAPPGEAEPDVHALLKDIRSGSADDRSAARYNLADAGRIYPIAPIIEAFGESDPSVRAICVEALGRIGDPAGADTLLRGLADPDDSVRTQAARAAARSGWWLRDERLVEPLLNLLTTGKDEKIRSAAAYSLGKYKQDGVVKALVAALKDPYCDARAGAATSLGKLGDPAAVPALIALINDKAASAAYIDVIAVRALGDIGGDAALAALGELFKAGRVYSFVGAAAVEKITGRPAAEFPPYGKALHNPP